MCVCIQNSGDSSENLTWSSDQDCIFFAKVELLLNWIKQKTYFYLYNVNELSKVAFLSLTQVKEVHFDLPNVREIGFRNRRNFYLWNPESGKILLVESRIPLLTTGIQNPSPSLNFAIDITLQLSYTLRAKYES